MRYVGGVDLGVLVDRLGPLSPRRAAAIVSQVAAALDAAHVRGLVHRDVKPANILLTGDEPEHAYLTDFGVAKITADEGTAMTSPGQWVGTVDYVSPEQLRGEPLDGRGDIYALGGGAVLLPHRLAALRARERDGQAVRARERRTAGSV
jgi:serine/threonine-protein kinase